MMKKFAILLLLMGVFNLQQLHAQKRKDLQGKQPEAAKLKIEHPAGAATPSNHSRALSKKSKLEHGTRAEHPPKSKAGIHHDRHPSQGTIQRRGSKQHVHHDTPPRQ
jgi:hypothetical protein